MTISNKKKTLIVVCGPTASGKTDLSIQIAKRFSTEIVSADSRQFYREMLIGTAPPSEEQLRQVKHHFIHNLSVQDDYSCGKYEQDALGCLKEIFTRNDVAVLVGGSGLYIDAVCCGFDEVPEVNLDLRRELMERYTAEGLEPLLEELKELDPEYYQIVDHANSHRVVRALEVCIETGKPYSVARKGLAQSAPRDFKTVKIGVNLPREELYDRINRRVDIMVENGLVEEARQLFPQRECNALQTVGYRELFDHFLGKSTLEEAIDLIKRNSRRYAKRQMTWFNRDSEISWFPPYYTEAICEFISQKLG